MQISRVASLCIAMASVLGSPGAESQGATTNPQFYQITAGAYRMVGGIWGSLSVPLPNRDQAFVRFETNAASERLEMTILGEDQQTVALTLTNGVASGDTVHFLHQAPHPYPNIETLGTLDYTVTNAAGALRISGSLLFPYIGPDIPTYYGHTNVEAVAMPVLQSRVSELELQWSAQSNRTYQVQYRSVLTSNLWQDLGPPIPGSSPTASTLDKIPAGEPRRFYRVVIVP